MSRNRKDFKTFYRFDGNGRIIPGSNILKKGYAPEEGTWKQTDAYECCNPLGTNYWVTDRYAEMIDAGGPFENTIQSVIDSEGNTYRVSVYPIPGPEDPQSTVGATILKQDANGDKLWEIWLFGGEGPFSLPLIIDAGLMILETGNLAFGGIWLDDNEGDITFGLDTFILSPEDGSVLSTAPASITPILPGGVGIGVMYLRGITQGDSPETFWVQLAIQDINEDQYTHVISFNLEDPFVTSSLTTSFVNNVFTQQYWYGGQATGGPDQEVEGAGIYYFIVNGTDLLEENYYSVINVVRFSGSSNPSLLNSFLLDTSNSSSDGEIMYMSTYAPGTPEESLYTIHYDSKITKVIGGLVSVDWRVGFNIDGDDYFDPIGIANDSLGNVFAAIVISNRFPNPSEIGFIKLSSDGVLDWAVKITLTTGDFGQNELRNSVIISGEQLSIVSQGSIDRNEYSGSAFKLGTSVKPKAGTYGNYIVSDLNVSVEVQPNPIITLVTPNSTTVGANDSSLTRIAPSEFLEFGFTVTNLQ